MAHPNWGEKLNHMQHLQTMTDGTKKKIVNSTYHQQTLPQITAYLHACVVSIPLTTWMKAITKEWFRSSPGFTTTAVQKHLQKSPVTVMGHMHQIIKGIRPLKKITTEQIMNNDMEQELPLEPSRGNQDRKH